MGSVGDAYNDGLCENFFAMLERELLNRRRLATRADVKLTPFEGPREPLSSTNDFPGEYGTRRSSLVVQRGPTSGAASV